MPKYPIFEGVADMKLRALLSVIIGCDAIPGGVKQFEPEKVYNKMANI